MRVSIIHSQLGANNTHVATKRNIFCWKEKPCHRLQSCKHCWNRKKKFLRDQMLEVTKKWGLQQMVTITVFTPSEHYESKLSELIKLRPKLIRKLKKYSKCIIAVAIHTGAERANAHFHVLTAPISKDDLQALLARWMIYPFNICVSRFYEPIETHSLNCLNYLLKNLRESLPCKPKNKQLLTASTGFYTGRPRSLNKKPEKFTWLI